MTAKLDRLVKQNLDNVALWCTADFFLLPDLKADIQECLLDRFAATLAFFHDFSLSLIASKAAHHQLVDNKDVIDSLFTVFPKAVTKIYKRPGARELHKLFAVFACGLREHLPAHIMWNLMKAIPEFQQDVSTVLVALHFPQATNEFVVGGLEELCVSENWAIYHGQSLHDRASYRCTGCGKLSSNMISKVKKCYMTLDPFSLGTRKWCNDCACTSIKSLIKTVTGGWPAGAPDRGEAR
ncbi:hypothetical protein N8I77_006692 [Diaporthe amygdali]|uniref:Uncharacterized protein n=1 Tax=Phomopsis amygdali TaxID=1214568 RepID=A0AAD9SH79_PHOAM|nr:hypothetical protein N8I77_006692 [Diaporthe amygdali]